MKSVIRRIERLENRLAPHQEEEEPILVVYTRSDRKLALDNDACVQILRDRVFVWKAIDARGSAVLLEGEERETTEEGSRDAILNTEAHTLPGGIGDGEEKKEEESC
jgi:hypothetical protein